jgi:hypothetical protein
MTIKQSWSRRRGTALAAAVATGLVVSMLVTPAAHADDKTKGGPQPPAFIDRAGKAIEKGVKKVGEGASWVGEKVGEGAKKVGAAVDRGAATAGKKMGVDSKGANTPQKKAEPANAGR